ncbi:MAG: substrate-binding domain-containing protein [Oscillospiraceae bacterium]|jgi:ABC-type sugar transport system substrate-binding protein|nr:substrate-binding domain-containing protein [Oscillospiraceae bacterium]
MKRILAMMLVIIMALALFACGGTGGDTGSGDSGGGNNGPAVASEAPKDDTKEWPEAAGFFDATYDYSKAKKFKVGYLVSASSFLYDEFDKAFVDWAARMNINYTGMWAPAAASVDEYMSGIETFVDQGYDGFLLDADVTLYPQVSALCDSLGIPWISCMGQAREAEQYMFGNQRIAGRLLSPNAGFNNTQFGVDMVDKLVEWKEEAWPDVPWEKVGVISIDFSFSPQLHERTDGAEIRWAEISGLGEYNPDSTINPPNFFIADTISGTLDQVTAQNLVVQILSNPGDVEIWLVAGAIDDFAMGAANAAENLGITDKVCSVCIGGSSLPPQWDVGTFTSWRYAEFTAQSVYAEPLIAALWSMMAGQATREELWPEWVKIWDKGDVYQLTDELFPPFNLPGVKLEGGVPVTSETHSYATLLLPTQWLDKDTYQVYLEWTDLYAYGDGAEGHYKYDKVSDLDLFTARIPVPAEYNTYPVG